MLRKILFLMFSVFCVNGFREEKKIPMVINTWAFINASTKAWETMIQFNKSSLDAVETGCSQCEIEQCDNTVGFGGSPDETGETTLDAMIIDGTSHDFGAVAALRRIKNAISVARKVLHFTNHTLLVGDQATKFAISMGFKEEDLSTNYSMKMWETWKEHSCQPNYWKNVLPNPRKHCGPYNIHSVFGPSSKKRSRTECHKFGPNNHDTIGMIAIDKFGNIAAGTSSNGAKFKIPGRVGDSPIPGSGAFVDKNVGGAAATGDGDIMMRFLPSYNTVENMRRGMDPFKAAEDSIKRIAHVYPTFIGAIIATNIRGEFGAACHGISQFPYCIANEIYKDATVKMVDCIKV